MAYHFFAFLSSKLFRPVGEETGTMIQYRSMPSEFHREANAKRFFFSRPAWHKGLRVEPALLFSLTVFVVGHSGRCITGIYDVSMVYSLTVMES
jgi:hypothetical protein